MASIDKIPASTQTAVTLLLSAMMVFVPAMGSNHEELLQDTLKSILVSAFTLSAALLLFWQLRDKTTRVNYHHLVWLPLGLMTFSLCSMAWSHTYLSGVEAIRWFVFSLIVFLGLNSLTLDRITHLVWGIHIGAVFASLWAALQFWFDFQFFAQGPNPASTFVNRNFFAEFLVCTIPFSILLLTRAKEKSSVFLLTFSVGFNIAALLMTGTRSALVGLSVLALLLPCIIYLNKRQVSSKNWHFSHCIALLVLLITSIFSISSIETRNPKIATEFGQGNAIKRALNRAASLTTSDEYRHGSFSIRTTLWEQSGRMIAANALIGVGPGAWEVHSPRYQEPRRQLETDYYAHNEILQLIAEYGIVGWLFLISLIAYLLQAGYHTWTNRTVQGRQEALVRSLTLSSLLVLFVVSNAGFAWHMATTGAIFALCLAILTASDSRLNFNTPAAQQLPVVGPNRSRCLLLLAAGCAVLAGYISFKAVECENKLISAIRLSLTVSQSRNAHDSHWSQTKTEILKLTKEAIAINPHYRKLTPLIADSMASWGDWENALWIWESILESRPHIVVLMANISRGYIQLENFTKAQEYLVKAQNIQPNAPTLGSLEVLLWSRTGRELEAARRSKEMLRAGAIDRDLLQTAYRLGVQTHDTELTIEALTLGIKTWPERATHGWLKLGQIYADPLTKDEGKAIQSYRAAVSAAPIEYKQAVSNMIPPHYRIQIR